MRDWGSGSITDAGGGRWRLRVSAGVDPFTGQRRIVNETVRGSRADARRRLAELVATHSGRTSVSAVTLRRVVGTWLDTARHATGTRRNYQRVIGYVPARVLDAPAVKIQPADIDRLLANVAAGHGAHTATYLQALLSGSYRHAIKRLRWLRDNPAAGAIIPEPAARASTTPTAAEVRSLLAAADGPLERLWLRLAAVLGRRRAEVLALRWSDIDLDAGGVKVQRALERSGEPKSTKTGDTPAIAIDPVTARLVRSWQTAQRERALAAGMPLAPDPWLISDEPDSSAPWLPDTATRRWGRLRQRAAVRRGIRLHDLRHANESELIAAGIDVRTVAGRAGHDPKMALGTYAGMVNEANRRAAEVIARVIDGW